MLILLLLYQIAIYNFAINFHSLSRDFMSFLPPSTFFGRTTRNVFHWSWLNTRHFRCMSRTAEAHAESLATEAVPITEPPRSFESLGLGTPFIQALQRAFPKVKTPTDTQVQLIPAILGTQDILLRDVTGSGKCVVLFFFKSYFEFVLNLLWIRSFGLMLGLANKPRLVSKEWKNGKEVEKHHITTILLVPHRDLAFQLYRLLDRIIKTLPKTRIDSLAYVLVRGTGVPIKRQLKRLEEKPPHILICTPKALLDAYKENRNGLQLSTLSTIAVDEVDYLIETVPRKDPNKSYREAHEKAKKKVARHPGLTRQFLDAIYSKRKERNERRYSSERSGEEGTVGRGWKKTQLILSSATLRTHLNNYLFEDSGWLDKDNLIKIFKDDERKKSGKKEVQKAGHSEVTGRQGTVLHSVLVVSEGETKNIVGARAVPELKWTKDEEVDEAEVDEGYDESKFRRTRATKKN